VVCGRPPLTAFEAPSESERTVDSLLDVYRVAGRQWGVVGTLSLTKQLLFSAVSGSNLG